MKVLQRLKGFFSQKKTYVFLTIGMLLASPAHPTDYPVSTAGELTTANAAARYGDNVIFNADIPTGAIAPANEGATYYSNLGRRANVGSLTFNGKQRVTINGFRTRNAVGGFGLANAVFLIDCAVYDTTESFSIGATDSVQVWNDSLLVKDIYHSFTPISSPWVPSTDYPFNTRFRRNFIYATSTGGVDPWRFRGSWYTRSDSNQYVLRTNAGQAGDTRGFIGYFSSYNSFNDDTLLFINGHAAAQGVYWREGTNNNTFTRCLIQQHPNSPFNVTVGWFHGSGDNVNYPNSSGHNNLIDSKISVNGNGIQFDYDGSSPVITGNQVYSWDGYAFVGNPNGTSFNVPDSLTMDRNSFVSGNVKPAILWEGFAPPGAQGPRPPNSFKNNIFFVEGLPPTHLGLYTLQGGRGNLNQDYNLFWSTSGDSTRSVSYNQSPSRVGPGSSWASQSLFPDAHSRFGDPQFTSITRYSLDLTPHPLSHAVGTYWPLGYVGAVNPDGVDATAPEPVSDLLVEASNMHSTDLSWTAPGDDEAVGTATTYDIRYATFEITPGNWNTASQFTGEPTPQVAGSSETWTTPAVLDGSTTYFYAMKTIDEVGNISALSNVIDALSAENTGRPGPITDLEAKYYAPGTAIITFTAVGSDSLDGTATSYDLRYGIGSTWFDTTDLWDAAGYVARTYHYDLEPAPRISGSADTIYVWGLQPGQTYDFMVKAVEEHFRPSTFSNSDSVIIPAQTALDVENYPRVGIYGGAGPGVNGATYPLVSVGGTFLQPTYIDSLSRFPVVSLAPGFTDDSTSSSPRYLAFSAMRELRTKNPSIKILGEPLGNVAYVGNRWSADTAKAFSYYANVARSLDKATGDSLKYIMSTAGNGQIVTNGSDATTSFLLRKATAPYKHMMWDVPRASTFGGQGNTLDNVDITDPRVRDSLVAIAGRYYIARRDPTTGLYAYDGMMIDLNRQQFYEAASSEGDTPDYARLRASYASRAAFDSAWVQAAHLYARALRTTAIRAGRPDFIISGNSASGIAYEAFNGWMREGWPGQQGTTWHTNFGWVPGGQVNDAQAFGWKPQYSWVFLPANTGGGTDSMYSGTLPYNETAYKDVRFGLGTASLTGARFMYGPSDASLARGGVHPGWYGGWWFDEYAVDALTKTTALTATGLGWLGQPLARYRQTSPLHGSGTGRSAGQDAYGGKGDFDDTEDMSIWWLTAGARVTDTTYAGAGALKISATVKNPTPYLAGVTMLGSGSYGTYNSGDTVSIEFWGRASSVLPMSIGLRDSASGLNVLDVSSNNKWWFDTEWTHHRIIGTVTSTTQAGPYFWVGDTTGSYWIDELKVIRGRPRGGLFYREFENGTVIVNPYATVDTFTALRDSRKIAGIPGRSSTLNNFTPVPLGGTVAVPARDAVFLINADYTDNTAPSTIVDILSKGSTSTSLTLSWTAPGDDGIDGTATSYDIRYSTLPINNGNWSSATQFTGEPTPATSGLAETWQTPSVLTPSTLYYFGIKSSDEVPNESALSNIDNYSTTAGTDVTPPSAITNLVVVNATVNSITVRWTAPGDDGAIGQATSYSIRYFDDVLDESTWEDGFIVPSNVTPAPSPPGTLQQYTLTGLSTSTTYQIAIKTFDEVNNAADISNVVQAVTQAPTLTTRRGWLRNAIRILIGR